MNLKDILAISGKGGLFKFISQARNGIIVESFLDKKRSVVHSSAKVSALEDIAVFTETEEVPLADVLKKLFQLQEGKPAISHKSEPDELKALMEKVLPEYDKDRVYVSDMRKLVQWYNQLLELDLLKPEEEEEKEADKEFEGKEDSKKTTEVKEKAAKPKSEPKAPGAAKPKSGKKAE